MCGEAREINIEARNERERSGGDCCLKTTSTHRGVPEGPAIQRSMAGDAREEYRRKVVKRKRTKRGVAATRHSEPRATAMAAGGSFGHPWI